MDADVRAYEPPPIEDAKRQYVELFGSALVMNTYLKIALLCVSSGRRRPPGPQFLDACKVRASEAAGHPD